MKKLVRTSLAAISMVAPVALVMASTAQPSFASATGAQKISLTLWQPGGAYPLNVLIKDFERAHPNVTVNLVTVPKSDNYLKYTTAMSSGTGPNLIMTFGAGPVQTWAADNLIMPLDRVLTEDHLKLPSFWPAVNYMEHYNGKLYGLPIEVDMPMLLWNKAMFKKAGIKEPPKTTSQLLADARKLTIMKNGKVVQAGLITADRFGDNVWVKYFGGQWFDPKKNQFVANSSHNIAAFQFLLKMYSLVGGIANANAFESGIKTGNAFLAGKEAMEIGGEWVPLEATPNLAWFKGMDKLNTGGTAALMKTPVMNYGISPVPVGPGFKPGSRIQITVGNTFVIPRNAAHPKTTALLLTYLTGPYASDYYNTNELNLPPSPSQAKVGSSLWKNSLALRPWLAELNKAGMSAKPEVSTPISGYWDQISWNDEQEILSGKVSPEQGLTQLNNDANNYLKQFLATHPK